MALLACRCHSTYHMTFIWDVLQHAHPLICWMLNLILHAAVLPVQGNMPKCNKIPQLDGVHCLAE